MLGRINPRRNHTEARQTLRQPRAMDRLASASGSASNSTQGSNGSSGTTAASNGRVIRIGCELNSGVKRLDGHDCDFQRWLVRIGVELDSEFGQFFGNGWNDQR